MTARIDDSHGGERREDGDAARRVAARDRRQARKREEREQVAEGDRWAIGVYEE